MDRLLVTDGVNGLMRTLRKEKTESGNQREIKADMGPIRKNRTTPTMPAMTKVETGVSGMQCP